MISLNTFFLSIANVILALIPAIAPARIATARAQANSATELVGLWEAKRRFGPDVRGSLLTKQTGSGRALLSSAPPVQTPPQPQPAATPAASVDQLVGLWKAKKRFGPDARGPLIIQKDGATYHADMMGRKVPVRADDGALSFDLPNGQGGFRGRPEGRLIRGHWIRPGTLVNFGESASPVILEPDGPDRWSGIVDPAQDEFTFYLMAEKRPDGSLGAVLRNPERDMGAQLGVDRLILDGKAVRLMGKRQGKEQEVSSGTYDADHQTFTLSFPNRGGTYDFRRDSDESDFYPRGKNPGRYVYRPPLARDDGWTAASLEDVNIDRGAMERFVQKLLDMPMDSLDAPQVHGILIARHGKLVLEEYFHGFHRDALHTTRSGSKSVTATLVGAAMQAGAPLKLSSPVYQVMNGGTFPPGLEPQKQTMMLEHLLTMSSGYFCDDTNENAPGNENDMWEQTQEPDFYRLYMKLPLDRQPGEKAVYCSGDSNLALGMVGRAMGENPIYTFDRLVAGPMKIDHYVWLLDRAGNPYGGGSMGFQLRDYLKFGQLMLNSGTWDGRRVLSRDFAARAWTPAYHLRNIFYGYLWWGEDYPYKGRTVYASLALGAGGQGIIVVPELDLAVAIFAGNYFSRIQSDINHAYVPRYILPAVRERSDDRNAPVTERDYKTPYGRSPNSGRVSPKKGSELLL